MWTCIEHGTKSEIPGECKDCDEKQDKIMDLDDEMIGEFIENGENEE